MARPLRVVLCGTGLAGCEALRALIERSEFELVGLVVHDAAKAGRDAGDFVGLAPTGIRASTDLDGLGALSPDVVLYMLIAPDLDLFCRLLSARLNVVTITGLMRPGWRDAAIQQRLEQACRAGGASFYVTGINPGFVNEILPLTLSHLSADLQRIQITETSNCATYPSASMLFDLMGFGATRERVEAGEVADLAVMADFFLESVAALGAELGLPLDDIRQTREFVTTARDLEIAAGRIPAGTVAGQRWRWTGLAKGEERIVQQTYWVLAPDLGPGWPGPLSAETVWSVEIEGRPSMRLAFELQPTLQRASSAAEFYSPASTGAAMAAVHSLAPVVTAPPGVVASIDLPQPRLRRGQS